MIRSVTKLRPGEATKHLGALDRAHGYDSRLLDDAGVQYWYTSICRTVIVKS